MAKPLTKAKKQEIYDAIYKNMAPDDKEPTQVIRESYGGAEEKYLVVMAKHHGIPLEE